MSPEDPLSEYEEEFSPTQETTQAAAMADAQDRIIELMSYYKKRLLASGFSEQACEMMCLQYHQKLLSW